MSRRAVLTCLVLLAGCDRIFGLERPPADAADAAIDGPPDAPYDTLPANCRVTFPLTTSADTYLDATDKVRGADDVLESTPGHPILLKFALDGVLGPTENVAAAVVHLDVVDRGLACGAGCGLCAARTATTYDVYWMTSNWTQDGATAVVRDTTADPWGADLAVGSGDRSVHLAHGTIAPTASGPVDLTINENAVNAVQANAWLENGRSRLGIQLLTDGVIAFASMERPGGACLDNPPRQPPTITLTVCGP